VVEDRACDGKVFMGLRRKLLCQGWTTLVHDIHYLPWRGVVRKQRTIKAWGIYQGECFSVREIYESRSEARRVAKDQRSWYEAALPSAIPRFVVRPITITYDDGRKK
jgi:hypothetical protein